MADLSLIVLVWRQATGRKRLLVSICFPLILALIAGCSFRSETNQLRLGVWAAEHDLWDEAIFRWQKALEKDPNSAILHNNLAVAYEKKGLWEKARAEYELALKLAPENRYIKANYNYFQENLKAGEKTAKPEDKKTDQKKAKKGSSTSPPEAAGCKEGTNLEGSLFYKKRASYGRS